jgi:hypothetical protein
MKKALVAAVVVSLLAGAGAALAGVTKFTFTNVAFPDGTTGTIRAGSKIVNKVDYSVCGYYTANDLFLGQFETADFATTDPGAMEDFCVLHYADRR